MKPKIGIIGLGYVGLPLAVEAGKKYPTVGFDISQERIEELKQAKDRTREVTGQELLEATQLSFSTDLNELGQCNFYIVTVPTPIDQYKQPDLTPLTSASTSVGQVLKKGDVVVYESTVYPGCTEEVCVPILETTSGLKFNQDFYCGYSPERINPGDKDRRIKDIKKVTSGSTVEISKTIDEFYLSIIPAGTHKASSIKIAEASKVIENTQRDINIAFVNELALIFSKMGIDTLEVLEAAGTKWNFLPFKPGLVGGHCIGVDPYYLTHKAQSLGHNPEIILSGRRINDDMGAYVASRVIKSLIGKGGSIAKSKVLVLGITFKENCPDIRNSKVIDIIDELKEYQLSVDVYDPLADPKEVKAEYGIDLNEEINDNYKAVILAVSHNEFKKLDWNKLKTEQAVIFDVKGFLPKSVYTDRL
ncbi:MAG: nucleotide sugar dehydrogenase [Cyclobacteriaceae bacterium]